MFITYATLFFVAFYWTIYILIKNSHKIDKLRKNNCRPEIKYTTITFVIFFLIIYGYFRLFEYWYIWFSFDFSIWSVIMGIILVIAHDAYFYAIHRLLHTKFFMKHVHYIHHMSNPSNIRSSYNFHPVEAIFYAGASVVIFIFDVNFYALLIAIFVNDFLTIMWHCGYEIFSDKIKNSRFYQYVATTSFHDLHHSRNNWNMALYFRHLDKIFKTESRDYEMSFDKSTKNI